MKEIFENYEQHSVSPSDKEMKSASKTYKKIFPISLDKNAKILDIGCGYGYFLYFLKNERYTNFLGIDLSKTELSFCKSFTENVKLADAFEFLKENKNYDLIVVNHMLEHLKKEDLMVFLKLVKESLKEGGELFIQVPNISNPYSLHSRYIDLTHEIGFTENSLKEVLGVIGFKTIIIFGTLTYGSWKSGVRNMITRIVYVLTKLSFRLQGFGAPKYLEPKLIAIVEK